MLKPLAKILAMATLLPFAGCSLAMRQVPYSYRPEQGEPACSGAALPVVDTLAAGGFGVLGGAILADGPDEEPPCQVPGFCLDTGIDEAVDSMRIIFGLTTLAIAAVYTVSAIHGYKNASRCREAQAAREDFVAGRTPPAPAAFVPAMPGAAPVPESVRVGEGAQCREHTDCRYGLGCDPTGHTCVELP